MKNFCVFVPDIEQLKNDIINLKSNRDLLKIFEIKDIKTKIEEFRNKYYKCCLVIDYPVNPQTSSIVELMFGFGKKNHSLMLYNDFEKYSIYPNFSEKQNFQIVCEFVNFAIDELTYLTKNMDINISDFDYIDVD